jgi:hypothetical protein
MSTNALRLAEWDFLVTLHRAGLRSVEFSFSYPDAAVYARITRAQPSAFPRLLQAMDNLALWQRDLGRKECSRLCANLVVSAYNAHRLDEVFAHLCRHLNPGRFFILLKRLAPRQPSPSLCVPLATLRRVLPRFAAHAASAGVPTAFSDFPLCAIPGWETLDQDLAYWLAEANVKQNFFSQNRVSKMFPPRHLRTSHPWDRLCDNCSLSPLCLKRGLFRDAGSKPQNRPRPLRGTLPNHLYAWMSHQARSPVFLKMVAAKLQSPRRWNRPSHV